MTSEAWGVVGDVLAMAMGVVWLVFVAQALVRDKNQELGWKGDTLVIAGGLIPLTWGCVRALGIQHALDTVNVLVLASLGAVLAVNFASTLGATLHLSGGRFALVNSLPLIYGVFGLAYVVLASVLAVLIDRPSINALFYVSLLAAGVGSFLDLRLHRRGKSGVTTKDHPRKLLVFAWAALVVGGSTTLLAVVDLIATWDAGTDDETCHLWNTICGDAGDVGTALAILTILVVVGVGLAVALLTVTPAPASTAPRPAPRADRGPRR